MKYSLLCITFFILFASDTKAQAFEQNFVNKTLRIDYHFSGTATTASVAVDQLIQLPQWAGRYTNLSSATRGGNGQIRMLDAKTGKCIYIKTFSTLFQEWQTTPEAKKVKRSFENTFLLPYPKNKVVVEVRLRSRAGLYNTVLRHEVKPDDILIEQKGSNSTTPYTMTHRGGGFSKSINVVFLAEGYRSIEMNKFREDAKKACDAIFAHKAFGQYKDKFNFFAVETPSENSGVSVPHNNNWVKTAFGSHFDTFYSERYLTTTNVKAVHDALAGIPYAHIIILANTEVYGGGGIFNAYTLTTAGHVDFAPVVVHEFGHSFAGLADEYYYEGDVFDNTYPRDVEPWEPNITTLVNFSSKWKKLLAPQTPIPTSTKHADKYPIGVYEGAGYSAKGIYRPAIDCRMKTNTAGEFCPACEDAIEKLIKYYTE